MIGQSAVEVLVSDVEVVLIHGFWSSPRTWDRLVGRFRADPDLAGARFHPFGYESPRFRWPWSRARIPEYEDIAESLPGYLAERVRDGSPLVMVTHSQGGLILQRYLAWMLSEGRGLDLVGIRRIVMLSCPHEGTEYVRSVRAAAGFAHRPQSRELDVLAEKVVRDRRIVLRQVVNARDVDDRNCPIPVHVFSGRTDQVVLRQSAQSVFPAAEVLPGDHASILDPTAPGSLTFPTLKRHILEAASTAAPGRRVTAPRDPAPPTGQPAGPETAHPTGDATYNIWFDGARGVQIGKNNDQYNG